MAIDVYAMITDRVISDMEKGITPWNKPWFGSVNRAVSYVTGKSYSLLNQFLLEDPGEYLTFYQCQQLGGRVRKGEKARFLVFWKLFNQAVESDSEVVFTGRKIPFLRYYNVFHISQCEGIKSKQMTVETPADPIEEAENLIADYLNRSGLKLVHVPGSGQAYYSPMEDKVVMPVKEQYHGKIAEYYSTVFHELIHSTGAKERLNRLNGQELAAFGSEDYSKEELVAEIGAAAILHRLGIDTENSNRNNSAYLQNWLRAIKGDKKLLVSASSKAEKAVKMIYGEA